MKAYISDPEDLKQDNTYQETWDDMIINVSILFVPVRFLFNGSAIQDYIHVIKSACNCGISSCNHDNVVLICALLRS